MNLPDDINFDKVIQAILSDMELVTAGWVAGRPRDETALLNRITERLQRNRRKCDVGTVVPVGMTARIFELHRKGARQTDGYAADLAVTIEIPSQQYKKTALFQLKISHDYVATLDKRQLFAALEWNEIAERSFVLAVDEERGGFRVCSTRVCNEAFKMDQVHQQFSTAEWDFLVEWLLKWFQCKEGPPSLPDDPNPIERLLETFAIPVDEFHPTRFRRENYPENLVPAKAWLQYIFEPKESADL